MYVYICMYMYVYMYACMYVCMYMYVRMYVLGFHTGGRGDTKLISTRNKISRYKPSGTPEATSDGLNKKLQCVLHDQFFPLHNKKSRT